MTSGPRAGAQVGGLAQKGEARHACNTILLIPAYCLFIVHLRETLSDGGIRGRHRSRRRRCMCHGVMVHAPAALRGWLCRRRPGVARDPYHRVQQFRSQTKSGKWKRRRRRCRCVHSRRRCCAGSVERCGSNAAQAQRRLRRPQSSIVHHDTSSTVSESCSRCSLALAGVHRALLVVLRGTEVAHRRLKRESEKSEAGEAAAGDLVYWTR